MPSGVPTATCCGQKWSAYVGLRSASSAVLMARRRQSPTPRGLGRPYPVRTESLRLRIRRALFQQLQRIGAARSCLSVTVLSSLVAKFPKCTCSVLFRKRRTLVLQLHQLCSRFKLHQRHQVVFIGRQVLSPQLHLSLSQQAFPRPVVSSIWGPLQAS